MDLEPVSQFEQSGIHRLGTPAAIGGFIATLVTVFKRTWAPVTTPIYALLEGFVLGGISAVTELHLPRDSDAGG
jgi:uncharacterized YccA/Bax inhibitor family protein